MKKLLCCLGIIILTGIMFFLAYGYMDNISPKTYYKVYLNDEVLGIVNSQKKLTKFIDKESESIKKKYNVDTVYAPEGLYIEAISGYDYTLSSVEEVFNQITSRATLTIEGYRISIKRDPEVVIYVLDQSVFRNAIIRLIKTYAGKTENGDSNYDIYLADSQEPIKDTGSIIENIYIQEDITIKPTKISVNNKIYQDEEELSQFLLFGPDAVTKKHVIQKGEDIKKIINNNEINEEEFLLSNPNFKGITTPGIEVTIAVPNPQLKVVVESHEVVDLENAFSTEERYDENMYVGEEKVIQNGENGTVRVSQEVQTINGSIAYVNPIDRKEIKPPINKVIAKGSKPVPHIGDLRNWAWPTLSGYTLTDDFEWRTNPITGKREHHSGIDIAGTGYGSPVYAANNGIIISKKYTHDYGYMIVINHNNGYWTLYAHMSKFAANIAEGDTVARGQLIGYVGSTGYSTGPHLHFELWKDCEHCRINPLTFYR